MMLFNVAAAVCVTWMQVALTKILSIYDVRKV